MGVPTSEVGYTPAMPRREDHEVHKGHVVALDQKKFSVKKKQYIWSEILVAMLLSAKSLEKLMLFFFAV